MSLGSLEGLAVVAAIRRTGSATAAARELGVGVATVLRRLARVEEALDCVLFDRAPSGLKPTASLERIWPLVEQLEDTARGIAMALAGLERRPEGPVRLATLPVVSSQLLVPAVPTLLAAYPRLALEMLPASAVVDLEGRQADLALRLRRPTEGDLVVQQATRFRLGVFASAERAPAWQATSAQHWPWVSWSSEVPTQPEEAWLRALAPEPRVVFRSSELESLLAAARAGVGTVVVATALGRAHGLVELEVPGDAPEGALWLVAHRAIRSAARVEAVWQWVLATLDQDASKVSRSA